MKQLFARFISFIFNPLLVLILLPFFLVYKTTNNLNSAIFWTVYSLFFIFAIAIFILVGVRNKIFANWDVSVRSQRPLLFSAFLLFGIIYLLGLYILKAPFILFVVILSLISGVILVSTINIKIKVSIHVATISALILGVILGFGASFAFLLIIIPLVGWSRIRIDRHTLSEVIVGWITGSLLLLGTYGIFKFILNK